MKDDLKKEKRRKKVLLSFFRALVPFLLSSLHLSFPLYFPSLLFFRRKSWPIIFGTGIGVGAGIQNCQNDLKNPFAILPGKIVKVNKDS